MFYFSLIIFSNYFNFFLINKKFLINISLYINYNCLILFSMESHNCVDLNVTGLENTKENKIKHCSIFHLNFYVKFYTFIC